SRSRRLLDHYPKVCRLIVRNLSHASILSPLCEFAQVPFTQMRATTETPVNVNQFGRWLRERIRSSPYVRNQSEFAQRVGTSTGTVSMWATGKRIPDPASCDRIADVLGVDLDLVLWQAGHRPNVERIDPDDPRTVLTALVNAVDWTQGDRFHFIEGI